MTIAKKSAYTCIDQQVIPFYWQRCIINWQHLQKYREGSSKIRLSNIKRLVSRRWQWGWTTQWFQERSSLPTEVVNSKDKEKARKLKKYFSHCHRIDIVVTHPIPNKSCKCCCQETHTHHHLQFNWSRNTLVWTMNIKLRTISSRNGVQTTFSSLHPFKFPQTWF
jgi:hypothetical protein